jgi:hypothetical protein
MSIDLAPPPLFNPDDPRTWGRPWPLIIGHDVGRSRDRSTAVVGGPCAHAPRLLGLTEFHELPSGFGYARASALAQIDRAHTSDALIVADLSQDPTYAEVLAEVFGYYRVIGLHITRHGDGMAAERRPVKNGSILVYNIGRSHLIELFHRELEARQVRFVDGPEARRAYQQLENLELELRDSGTVYTCPSGQHDDLGISCCMVAWAARHQHLSHWHRSLALVRQPRRSSKGRISPLGWC